jgi:hypothetical protein
VGTEGNFWERHIEAATLTVQRANDGDAHAAAHVLAEAIIGLRGWLRHGEGPDPHRLVYLKGLLACLEEIERGTDPADALHLKHGHRPESQGAAIRDVLLWKAVGEELDRLTNERGHTRMDKPTAAAIAAVAKQWNEGEPTVSKAWNNEPHWVSRRPVGLSQTGLV